MSIYEAKGLPENLAKSPTEQPITNKKTVLDTLVRGEFEIDSEELGLGGGSTSFLLFVVGAIFPVAPYFALTGMPSTIASL